MILKIRGLMATPTGPIIQGLHCGFKDYPKEPMVTYRYERNLKVKCVPSWSLDYLKRLMSFKRCQGIMIVKGSKR